jgi:hypothetical protein
MGLPVVEEMIANKVMASASADIATFITVTEVDRCERQR